MNSRQYHKTSKWLSGGCLHKEIKKYTHLLPGPDLDRGGGGTSGSGAPQYKKCIDCKNNFKYNFQFVIQAGVI